MSIVMEEEVKGAIARWKLAPVLEIIYGKTIIAVGRPAFRFDTL